MALSKLEPIQPIKINLNQDFSVKATYGTYNDKVKEAVAQINNVTAYNFEFKQAKETIDFFKNFKLTDVGEKVGTEPPQIIYDIIKKSLIDKLYKEFMQLLQDSFNYKKVSEKQLFKNLLPGIKVKSNDPNIKNSVDQKTTEFNNSSLTNDNIIDYLYDNPKKLIPGKDIPKALLIAGSSNQFYETGPVLVDKEKIINYLNTTFKVLIDQLPTFNINQQILYKIIDSNSSDTSSVKQYLNKVKEIYIEEQSLYNGVGYKPYSKSITSSIQKIIDSLNNVISYIDSHNKDIIDLKITSNMPTNSIKNKKDVYMIIQYYLIEQKKVLDSLDKTVKDELVVQLPIVAPGSSPNAITSFGQGMQAYKTYLIDPIINQFNQKYKEFIDYYNLLFNEIQSKIAPYLSILQNTDIKFPTYIYSSGLVEPTYYGGLPDLTIDLLYNKKVDLYRNKDPKLLFTFSRPELFSNKNYVSSVKNKEGKGQYIASDEQKLINSIQPNKIFIYRTDTEIKNIQPDFVNRANLYKILDTYNNELSFYDNLEPNKDYYYFYVSKITDPSDDLVYDIFGNNVIVSGEDLYWYCSQVFKVKLIKDSSFYYIEKNIVNFDIKKSYEELFSYKISVSPKSLTFGFGGNGFYEGQRDYVKIRITSKKTRKKFDLNLKYTINKDTVELDAYQKKVLKAENVEDLSDEIIKKFIKNKFSNIDVTQEIKDAAEQLNIIESIEKIKTNIF